MSMRRENSSSEVSMIGLPISMPALLTLTSRPPNACTVSAIAFWTSPGLVTSQLRAIAWPPIPCAACSAAAPSRSASATRAPRSANSCAMARPRPRAAPVTSARLPSSSTIVPPSLLVGHQRTCRDAADGGRRRLQRGRARVAGDLCRGNEAERLQHAEELAVPEGLARRRESDPARRAVDEVVGRVGLEQTGLLVVAGALQDAVHVP